MSEEEHDPLDVSAWLITLSYILTFSVLLIVYFFLDLFWGEHILLEFSELQGPGKPMAEGLSRVWFIFLWGAGVTLFLGALRHNNIRQHEPGTVLVKGWWISINAGIFEELIYRWLVFFMAMVTLPFLNFLTFGLVKWFYGELLVPLANWSTFGALEAQLFHPESWVIGAAIVSASASFRDAHEHLGFLGWINSWFIGMVMFFLVFNYGIVAAIVAHVLYDVAVFTAQAIATTWQRRSLFSAVWG